MFKVANPIRTLTTIATAVAAGAIIWASGMSPMNASADGDVLDHEGDRVFTLTDQVDLTGVLFDDDGNPIWNMGIQQTPDMTGVAFDEEGDPIYSLVNRTEFTASNLIDAAGLDHDGDRMYTLDHPDLRGVEFDEEGDPVYTLTNTIDLSGVEFDEDGDPIWSSIR